MAINGTEPGYPPQHFAEMRAAQRYAIRAIAVTGTSVALLLAATIFGSIAAFMAEYPLCQKARLQVIA